MKPKEKIWILILVSITIIMIIILNSRGRNKNENVETSNDNTSKSELVQIQEDGTKQLTSNKLQENKKVGDLEFSNVQIIEKDGNVTLTANITNNSSVTMQEKAFKIKLLNKSGETIETLGALVGTIKPGETRGINAQINMDISEVYDISTEM